MDFIGESDGAIAVGGKPASPSWRPMSFIENGDLLRGSKLVQQPGEELHEGDS
jgi:hypothetical protein